MFQMYALQDDFEVSIQTESSTFVHLVLAEN